MKTAVSITRRSELYREALADYLARRDPQAVTVALNSLVDELSRDRAGFIDEAARRALDRSRW